METDWLVLLCVISVLPAVQSARLDSHFLRPRPFIGIYRDSLTKAQMSTCASDPKRIKNEKEKKETRYLTLTRVDSFGRRGARNSVCVQAAQRSRVMSVISLVDYVTAIGITKIPMRIPPINRRTERSGRKILDLS